MSTQILGFSFAGYLHRFLVRPSSMIWPATLVNTARSYLSTFRRQKISSVVCNALHPRSGLTVERKKGKARQTFFYSQTVTMFAWSFLPSYLFTALSNVSTSSFNPGAAYRWY